METDGYRLPQRALARRKMGRKGGKYKKKENNAPKKENNAPKKKAMYEDDDMMNDEIDACKLSLPLDFSFHFLFWLTLLLKLFHEKRKEEIIIIFFVIC